MTLAPAGVVRSTITVWITKGMKTVEQEALAVWPPPAISCSWLRRYQPHAAIG
jgi:hypothetical protein